MPPDRFDFIDPCERVDSQRYAGGRKFLLTSFAVGCLATVVNIAASALPTTIAWRLERLPDWPASGEQFSESEWRSYLQLAAALQHIDPTALSLIFQRYCETSFTAAPHDPYRELNLFLLLRIMFDTSIPGTIEPRVWLGLDRDSFRPKITKLTAASPTWPFEWQSECTALIERTPRSAFLHDPYPAGEEYLDLLRKFPFRRLADCIQIEVSE